MRLSLGHGSAALDGFVRDLREFMRACCVSSDRELINRAPRVMARHRRDIPQLRPLSPAVVSAVMSRKRQKPPPWGWVATYVLTCLDILEGSGAELDFDGPADLQSWYEHYQAMCQRHDREAAAARPRTPPGTGDGPAAPDRSGARQDAPRDGPVSAFPPPPPGPPAPPAPITPILRRQDLHDTALEAWTPRLRQQQSRAHRRHYELLGPHGADLLTAAEGGDREAARQLGIVLLCHDRPNEALAWLTSAADNGDEPAAILLNAAPSRRREMAAELAYEFTLPGYAQDRPSGDAPTGAEVYYRAATIAGHMGATVRMGLIYEARGELATALNTFALAAARCHPDGLAHFERLNNQICRGQENGL
ncbi:hypothetical protein ACFVH6_30495 [Spirillospora sp. NPDC127200]